MVCGSSKSDSDPNTTATLCDLPTELLLEIIQHLDNPALLNLSLTCRCVNTLALETFFYNNDICNPKSGRLYACYTPVETLPAFRNALFLRKLDEVHYYFNAGTDRMIKEVKDLQALISRMPTIELVKLHFDLVDQYFKFVKGEHQVVNLQVWKKEFQGLLDLVLEKGCEELYVHGGKAVIKLYPEQVVEIPDVEAAGVDIQQLVEPYLGRERANRKSLLGTASTWTPNVELETPDTQKGTHSPIVPVRGIKLTKFSIHSEILLRNPFLEWTIAKLNSGASTITTLSMELSVLPRDIWKIFLNSVTLSQLSDFEIISKPTEPRKLHGVCFAGVHSFLGNHPSIEVLHLYGVDIPEGVRPLTIPIFPHLKRIIAHPFYVAWILDGLLLDKEASPTLTDIGISSEYCSTDAEFDYALFDDALERVAVFPTAKIKLTLRFDSTGQNSHTKWFESHVSKMHDTSKSSIISRLNNVTSLVISSFLYVYYDWELIEVLPDWLGMFPNVTAIQFIDHSYTTADALGRKEFVMKVAVACPKVAFLHVDRRTFCLDEARRNFRIKMNAEGGEGSGIRKG